MDNLAIVQNVLKEFGKIIELDSIALNDTGSCKLVLDDLEIHLEIDDATDSLMLLSPVAEATEQLMADALELNLFWGHLNGCRFTLLRSINVLALLHRLPTTGLDITVFEKELNTFADTALTWKRAFNEMPVPDEQPTMPDCELQKQNLLNQI